MNRIIALVIGIAALVWVGFSTVYIVNQTQRTIITSRDGANPVIEGPGLHIKSPLQKSTFIDMRVQTLVTPDMASYTSLDKTDLLVSPVLKYRVSDPLKLYTETKGDLSTLSAQLDSVMRNALNNTFSQRKLTDVLGMQEAVTSQVRDTMQQQVSRLGVDIIAVQLARVDFPAAMTDAVYQRMTKEFEQTAEQERIQSDVDAAHIKADIERQRQTILADAYKEAQTIKGGGDGKAAMIAAQAFGRDPQFYQFYQSLQAYRNIFKPGDVVVVDSSNDFFRYMQSPDAPAHPSSKR